MSFTRQRADLAENLAQLEDLLRQAQGASRTLEEQVAAMAGQTETFADDTLVVQITAAAKRARQDLGALIRTVNSAKSEAAGH